MDENISINNEKKKEELLEIKKLLEDGLRPEVTINELASPRCFMKQGMKAILLQAEEVYGVDLEGGGYLPAWKFVLDVGDFFEHNTRINKAFAQAKELPRTSHVFVEPVVNGRVFFDLIDDSPKGHP